jgi:hypothetical protein
VKWRARTARQPLCVADLAALSRGNKKLALRPVWSQQDRARRRVTAHVNKDSQVMVQPDTDQIFREVDEELRKERFEQLWKDYGTYAAAAALAVVLSVGGWKAYEYQQAKRTAEAGAKFNAALLLLESKKTEEGEKALRGLTSSGPASYQTLARMRVAAIEQADGRGEAAVKAYDTIAADSRADTLLRGLASIKAAMLRIDSADWTEMQNRLTPFKDVKNPWHASAKELLGLAAWKAGKLPEAEAEYQAIVADPKAPQGVRQRAEVMLALLLDAAKPAVGSAVGAPASVTLTVPSATAPPQAPGKEPVVSPEQPSPKGAGAKAAGGAAGGTAGAKGAPK